jgi:hypothetical protein
MAIGPDGTIIRRRVRFFTPVNTHNPSEKTGFFMGLFSVLVLSVFLVLAFMLIGWLGSLFPNFSWWTTKNFRTIGFFVNLLVFPIFISGVLEGLAGVNFSRFRFYAFLYGTIAMGFLVFLYQLSNTGFNYYTYLWAAVYGIYSMWLAARNVRR